MTPFALGSTFSMRALARLGSHVSLNGRLTLVGRTSILTSGMILGSALSIRATVRAGSELSAFANLQI